MWDYEMPLNVDDLFLFSGRNGAEDPRTARNPSGRRLVAGTGGKKTRFMNFHCVLNKTGFMF
jgi:hypothetical protein